MDRKKCSAKMSDKHNNVGLLIDEAKDFFALFDQHSNQLFKLIDNTDFQHNLENYQKIQKANSLEGLPTEIFEELPTEAESKEFEEAFLAWQNDPARQEEDGKRLMAALFGLSV